ncbi:MAG TPA: hypothetical protein VFV86_06835 [Nitrososphaeraceae archaeon]|nr:hypothetical protein [Nitrososphaeraceae archaeon]
MNNKKENISKRYKPDPKIEHFMVERISFNKILETKKKYALSAKEENLGTKLRQDKKRLLDNVIFPSMTNLIEFFEYLKDNEELRELFENDIKELFDLKHNIIGNFLDSVLTWDIEKDPDNFRLGLIVELQQVVFHKLVNSMSGSIYDKAQLTILSKTIDEDMRKALSWTQFWYSSKFVEKERKINSA